jgi:hypothetical protein
MCLDFLVEGYLMNCEINQFTTTNIALFLIFSCIILCSFNLYSFYFHTTNDGFEIACIAIIVIVVTFTAISKHF